MIKDKRYLIRIIYILIDVCLSSFCIYLACLLRSKTIPFEPSFYNIFFHPLNPFRFTFVLWVVVTIFFLNAQSLYKTRREILEGFEIEKVIKSIFFSVLLVIGFIYGFKIIGFPRTILFIGAVIMVFMLSLWRILKRRFVEYLVRQGYNNVNALIIGAGKVGQTLAREIRLHTGLGIKVVGFLDDFKKGPIADGDIVVLGKIEDFKIIAQREFVRKVFITIHHDSGVFMRLLEEAKELQIAVRVIPQGFDLMMGDFGKYNIGIIPVIEYCDAMPFKRQLGKRVFDFCMSLLGIILFFPVFLILAFLIKKDSPGPVFYVSKRYGRGGRIFNMYKFRSMFRNADKRLNDILDQNEVDGPIFKIKKDPRVTKIGKFLRKYSLDELPQLINVLKGDMSLVGPRPLPIDQIEKEDLNQLKRLEVRPGITGLWQIRGRSDVSFSRLVKWDLWYINNWSFWLDLSILFQTIPVVLKGKGAY